MTRHLLLYHALTACSRVTLTALEQCGHPYEDRLLVMQKGEHKAPTFLAVNPDGKVPTLVIDGRPLAENGAILLWLNDTFPEAGLFPPAPTAWDKARHLSDLMWLSSGWHPYVRANKMPGLWTIGDVEPVRARGRELLDGVVAQLEERLADRPWWYGEDWSIIDTYLWWAYTNAEIGGYSIAAFPQVEQHRARHEALPQLQRALAREAAAFRARAEEDNT